jgi:hypothetical protein
MAQHATDRRFAVPQRSDERVFALASHSTSRLEVVCPKEFLRFKDWVIHPGTAVGTSLRHILHDPSIYPDPHAFKPER